jgi:hypothetical protein
MIGNASTAFQTEVEFELPKGYVDSSGTLHRSGVMRLATAADEILPLRDPRVAQNEAYLSVIILARVIVRLGSLPDIHTGVIEGLYASDFAYLQKLYERINGADDDTDSLPPAVRGGDGAHALRRLGTLGEA